MTAVRCNRAIRRRVEPVRSERTLFPSSRIRDLSLGCGAFMERWGDRDQRVV